MRLHVLAPPRQAQAILTVNAVRACCDSAVDFTDKKVVSVVVIFKIEVARDSYVPEQRIRPSWEFVDFWVARGELPPPRYGRWRLRLAHELHRRAETNASYLSLKLSNHFTQTFPEKTLSSPFMPCWRAFFSVRNRAGPMSDCMEDRRPIDGSGSAHRKI